MNKQIVTTFCYCSRQEQVACHFSLEYRLPYIQHNVQLLTVNLKNVTWTSIATPLVVNIIPC